jgi:hypothetical protein
MRGINAGFPVSGFAAHARPVTYDRGSRSYVRIAASEPRELVPIAR